MLRLVSILVASLASTSLASPIPQAPPVASDCTILNQAFPSVFDPSVDCCNHESVTCVNGQVTALSLFFRNLFGPIPTSLSKLTSLQSLDLSENALNGSIPDLSSLKNLQSLALNGNHLKGPIPTSLSTLDSLTSLQLTANAFDGPIPDTLFNFKNLQSLILAGNAFNGSIPMNLSKLVKLQSLYLNGNNLSGPIPDIFGNFTSLTDLNLSFNQLTGSLPQSLLYQKSLTEMVLNDNPELVGPIGNDSNMLPSLKRWHILTTNLTLVDPLQKRLFSW